MLPLAWLFAALTSLRRLAYRTGLLPTVAVARPVVIVGNITVGVVGKTPLVIELAREMARRGRAVGVVSRGYGASYSGIREVDERSNARQCGDEPLLLKRATGVPVFVGKDRAAAANALLASHPDVKLIISDDGLQHYRLPRAIELAVVDTRGWMNGRMLPAGPLREPVSRLYGVDAIVGSGITVPPASTPERPFFAMQLRPGQWYSLQVPAESLAHGEFAARMKGQRLHAVAGIGDPARFFAQLRALDLDFSEHVFPDHHAYAPDELEFAGDAILTTEKDAVKLAAPELSGKLTLPVWVLPVTCRLEPDLVTFILEKLDGRPIA